MDSDKAKRRQSLKVIISEVIMVLTVFVTVVILAFLVSGYWINSSFEVERQGLLQISSMPTGADVYIDGDSSWLQRTDTSKVLTSGEHSITLTKDGYDSWSKTINISEGLVYRVHYPRLFLSDSTTEEVYSVPGATKGLVSPDHNRLLLINDSTSWQLLSLDSEQIKSTTIDISNLFSIDASNEEKQKFISNITSLNWDRDSSHVLVETTTSGVSEWAIIDTNNSEKNLNLSKEFNINFSNIMILDGSANNLLALSEGNLHKIDVSGRSMSPVLIEGVIDYDHYDSSEVVFSAKTIPGDDSSEYYIGYLRLSDGKVSRFLDTDSPAKVTISRFYNSKYITVLHDNEVAIYEKDDPTKVNIYQLSFVPEQIKVGHDGEFITMSLDNKIATLDMEAQIIREWFTDSDKFGWIDNDMLYSVADNALIVYDFDGLNRRVISEDVTDNLPATFNGSKWLYYFDNDRLMRKTIAD